MSAKDVLFSFVCKCFGKVEEGRFIAVILVLFRHSDSRTNRANTRFRISTSIFAVVFLTHNKNINFSDIKIQNKILL